MIDLGDPVSLRVLVYDDTVVPPVLANATTVTLSITKPDGTAATVTNPVVASPTGVYSYTYTPTVVGRHTVRWVATGTNACAYGDAFDVVDSSTALVSFDRVRQHENFLTSADDEELRPFVLAASVWADRTYGPFGRQTYVETHNPAYAGCIPLNHYPVISLTSVIGAYGYVATVDVSTLHVTDAGILEPNLGGTLGYYPLTITYVAGMAVLTEDVQIGVLEVIAGLWETQHGGGGSGGPEALLQAAGEEELVANMGLRYWRADMLLRSYRAPVVA